MLKCRSIRSIFGILLYTFVFIANSHKLTNYCKNVHRNNFLINRNPFLFIYRNNLDQLSFGRTGYPCIYTRVFDKTEEITSKPAQVNKDFQISEVDIDKYRNIGIMAHIDAGKTTTTERILYLTGVTYKLGEVHEGQAVMDYLPQERERGITITSAATTCYWRGGYRKIPLHRINIIDTPGHVDFTVEVERSLRVLDGGVVVFDGVAGVEPQSETVWRQADKYKIPRIAYVNKMDRIGADFDACMEQMKEKLGAFPIPIFSPVGVHSDFEGVIDIIRGKFYKFSMEKCNFNYEELEIPKKSMEKYTKYRELLMETVAQQSDELLDKYLSEEPLSDKEVRQTLRSLTLSNTIVPVACGSSLKNKNIQGILDMILDFLPSPCESKKLFVDSIKVDEDSGDDFKRDEDSFNVKDFTLPFASLVFKLNYDIQMGTQSFVRVYRGKIRSGDSVYNPRTGKSQKVQKILFVHSNTRKQIKEAHAGDIVSLVGVKATTGDTLCSPDEPIMLSPIEFPEPVISFSVEIVDKNDDLRMSPILDRYAEEDPSFKWQMNKETGQTIISGMGELHLEVAVDRIRREHKLELKTGSPRVAFKETFVKEVKSEGKFIKQTGGRGQYGHVNLLVVPLQQGSGIEFYNKITCGAIPKEYIPHIEDAVREELHTGLYANYPVTDVSVTLYDGSFHEVDSSEFAFKMATARGIREAAKLSGMKLLEPIMKVNIVIPTIYFGEVMADLSRRRGRITNTKDSQGNCKEIIGVAPLKEMTGYTTKLRSITQGRGYYTMEMSHYLPVPQYIQEEIVSEKVSNDGKKAP